MRRNRFLMCTVMMSVGIFLLLSGGSPCAAKDPVLTLKMADYFPIGHLGNLAAQRFIERVEELAGGRVKIAYFPAQQLGKIQDMMKLCQMGITDIAGVPPSIFSGQVPLNTVMVLPFWTTATEGTRIYGKMLAACPELTEEFLRYGVRPIVAVATSQYDVGTVNQPVRSPEDLEGLQLKSSGGIFLTIAKRYGIRPISIPAPEIYEATRRGIVDGNVLSFGSVKAYRLNEIEKYHTYGLKMGGYPSTYQINEKVWQKLSTEIRDAITQASQECAAWFSREWDAQQEALSAQYEKEGMNIYRIPAEERARWFAPLEGIEEEWIQGMEKRKLPGRKIFSKYREISREVVGE